MTTRDVLRWNFAPLDMLLVSGIALAGFAVGCLEAAADGIGRLIDKASTWR